MERSKTFQSNERNLPPSVFLRVKSNVSHQLDSPLLASRFCPDINSCNILALGDESGILTVIDAEKECRPDSCQTRFSAHNDLVFDVAWVHSNPQRLITVSADRTAILWDWQTKTRISTFLGHQGSIKCVSVPFDDPNLFATAARDGHVMIWDARNRVKFDDGIAPVNVIRNAHFVAPPNAKNSPKSKCTRLKETPNPVTAILFPERRSVISGACTESKIRCWDLRKTYTFLKADPTPVRKFVYRETTTKTRRFGFTHFASDAYRSSFFAPCTDNVIYEYSMVGLDDKPISKFRGGEIRSFYVQCAISPNLPYLLCGSTSKNAYLWNLRKPCAPEYFLDGHTEEITSVAFNERFEMVTCSDDYTWRRWKYEPQCDDFDDEIKSIYVARCHRYVNNLNDTTSEVGERLKRISVSLTSASPLTETTNLNESTTKKRTLFESPGKENASRKFHKMGTPSKAASVHVSVFSYPSPTYNLPNLVSKTSGFSKFDSIEVQAKQYGKSFIDGHSFARKISTQVTTTNTSNIKVAKTSSLLNGVKGAKCKQPGTKTLLDYFHRL